MNKVTDTGLAGISILSLTAVLPFLNGGKIIEAIIAAVVGFGLLYAKYHLRG